MSVNEKMTAIADAVRIKTGSTQKLSLDGIADGVEDVFEAGKKTGYDAFWDAFQDYGNRTDYQVAFSRGFPMEAYNPKYDLQGNVNSVFGMGKIIDAKVKILNATDITQMGRYNSVLARIPELNMMESTVIGSDNNPFLGATKLSELIMTGVLAKSIIFSSCPLNADSVRSIISCMKDFSGTDKEYSFTITFKSSSFSKLEAEDSTSPHGNTWAEYIDDLKWNLTLA